MENRNGLVVDAQVTHATSTAEREAAEAMVKRTIHKPGVTLAKKVEALAFSIFKELLPLSQVYDANVFKSKVI